MLSFLNRCGPYPSHHHCFIAHWEHRSPWLTVWTWEMCLNDKPFFHVCWRSGNSRNSVMSEKPLELLSWLSFSSFYYPALAQGKFLVPFEHCFVHPKSRLSWPLNYMGCFVVMKEKSKESKQLLSQIQNILAENNKYLFSS